MSNTRHTKSLMKLYDILLAAVSVYGPIDLAGIVDIINLYYGRKYERYYSFLTEMLELLCSEDLEKNESGQYSLVPFEVIESIRKTTPELFMESGVLPRKVFDSAEEFLRFSNIFDHDNLPSTKRLYEYLKTMNIDEDTREDLFRAGVAMAIQMVSAECFSSYVSKHTDVFFDEDLVTQMIDAITLEFPRGFMNGNSFADLIFEDADDDFFEENHRITAKVKPSYSNASFRDCISLADVISDSNMFDLVEPGTLFELWINERPVYCLSIVAEDTDLLIIMNREELLKSYHYIMNADDYPDQMMRTEAIFVALDDDGEMMDLVDLGDAERLLYSEHSIVRHKALMPFETVSDQNDIDVLYGVLKELAAVSGSSDLKNALAELEAVECDVNQLYVYDNGRYELGRYGDFQLFDPYIPFECEELSDRNRKKLYNCRKNDDISIGIYVSRHLDEDAKTSKYLIFVYDDTTGTMVDMLVRDESEMKEIVNDVAYLLTDNDIQPARMTFNNAFALDIFSDFVYSCDDFACERNVLDEFYEMFEGMMDEEDPLIIN